MQPLPYSELHSFLEESDHSLTCHLPMGLLEHPYYPRSLYPQACPLPPEAFVAEKTEALRKGNDYSAWQ